MRGEREFIYAIDCRFPFGDRDAALHTVDEGCSISTRAAFVVVDEIVRPPASAAASVSFREELLGRVWDRLEHPLVKVIRPLAERLVRGGDVTLEEALGAMREIQKYPGHFGALSTASFSAEDEGDQLEHADAAIRRAWAEHGTSQHS